MHPSLYSSQFVYTLVMCWHFKSVRIVSLPRILGFCDVFVILSLFDMLGFVCISKCCGGGGGGGGGGRHAQIFFCDHTYYLLLLGIPVYCTQKLG